jgi:uncharacterized membrane protein YccC
MLTWLVAVAVLVLIWGRLWTRNLELALGILIGLPLAWLASKFLTPYFTGMQEIPVWLPPLPIAIIATLLFIKGALVWIRGNDALPKGAPEDEHHH